MQKFVINLKSNMNKPKNSSYLHLNSHQNKISTNYFRNEEKLRTNFNRELEEIKHKYEQSVEKQEEKTKYDLQQIDKLSVERKLAHENEKQKVRLYKLIPLTFVFRNSLSTNMNNIFEKLKNNIRKKLMNMKNGLKC
jgi:hypothetical protein